LVVNLSWEKAKDKKIKSVDDRDLGKIKNVLNHFVEVEKGTIGKDHFFIPKYYFESYDGDDVWISLTENEVKEKFENQDHPPSSDVFIDDVSYQERKEYVEEKYPNFNQGIYPRYEETENLNSQGGKSVSKQEMGVSWAELLNKEVKTSDDKEVGKIKSVAQHFVEVEEGLVHKNRYFIPKKYLKEFDGEHVYSSLSKDEIESKYERDSPPLESDILYEKGNYSELIPFMAKEPGIEVQGENKSKELLNVPWEEVIHKKVRASDDVDVGDVDRVGNDVLIVRDGVVNVHMYYIPKKHIENYDGSYIWLKLPSTLLSAKYERKTEPSPAELQLLLDE